jgi:hypothetical protein
VSDTVADPIPFLRALAKLISLSTDENAEQKARGQAANDCLDAGLLLFRDLLRSVPRDWSLRQFLVTAWRTIPVKEYLSEPLADVIRAVKQSPPIRLQTQFEGERNLLDQTCDWIADHLHYHSPFTASELELVAAVGSSWPGNVPTTWR